MQIILLFLCFIFLSTYSFAESFFGGSTVQYSSTLSLIGTTFTKLCGPGHSMLRPDDAVMLGPNMLVAEEFSFSK